MSKIPEKGELIRFDHLKIKRNAIKHCTCEQASYEIDTVNSMVNCMICGALVDPLKALLKVSDQMASLNERTDAYWDQVMAMKQKYLTLEKLVAQAEADLNYYRSEYEALQRKMDLLTADLSRIKHESK